MRRLVCCLMLFLTSCLHVDQHHTQTCDPTRLYACEGVEVHNVRLIFHVPSIIEKTELDLAGIHEYVAHAQEFFYNSNIVFFDVEVVHDMPPYKLAYNTSFESMDVFYRITRVDPRGIHIFVVDGIHDVERPELTIVGLQHSRFTNSCKNVIFLTNGISKQTFVHELGHYFGLNHVVDVNNIMHRGLLSRAHDAKFRKNQYKRMNTYAKFVVDYCVRDENYHVK